KGGQHNIVSTITTLPTPHNPTPPPHKLPSTKFIKHTINTIPKIPPTKPLHLQLPFSQSPFKHQPNQSYPQYPKPIPNTKLSDTQHHPLNHLTTPPPQNLNQITTFNPNILYTSYTPPP
ncbi:lipase-like domain-containing protein, partial [Staphylococcus epidermidis]